LNPFSNKKYHQHLVTMPPVSTLGKGYPASFFIVPIFSQIWRSSFRPHLNRMAGSSNPCTSSHVQARLVL
jgi:hypothetical protein